MEITMLDSVIFFVLICPFIASAHPTGLKFGEAFQEFIETNKYNGAQAAVIVGNKLVYAKAYGKGHDQTNIDLLAKHQISAISKAFTSIATLKLYDEGKLDLNSKVFGSDGILQKLSPWKNENVDKRIYDITVENILYHTGGWDYAHSDLADPILNSVLLKRGSTTTNISHEMNLGKEPIVTDIIQYMLSKRLDYTPGTKSVISNLGYVILGRIIEEVTGVSYENYVKHDILFPCGMLQTRIAKKHRCVKHDNDPAYTCEVSSKMVDAALGWESNMYDLSRFSQCIDGSVDFSIVSDNMTSVLLKKPSAVPVKHRDTWMGPGFYVNSKGAFWIEGERFSDDLIFFNTGVKTSKSDIHKPTSWIVLLEGQNHAPVRQLMREMIRDEYNWPSENHLLDDVSDVIVNVGSTQRIIKYEINEHHIKPYVHAVSLLRYDVKWIHGHMISGSSIFTVIAEQRSKPIYDKIIIEPGLSEKRLETQKLHLQKSQFNLTFLHTYRSYSHDKRAVFLAIYRKHGYANTTIIRYGEEHFTQPYRKLLRLFEERGFYPTSQSIVHKGYDGLVSFILEEDPTSKQKDFKSYCEVGHHRLNNLVMASFRHGRRLKYLDSSDYFGKPVFSAIFVKEKMNKIMFNSNLKEDELMTFLIEQQGNGFLPSIIVGYTDKLGHLKYAAYLEPPM